LNDLENSIIEGLFDKDKFDGEDQDNNGDEEDVNYDVQSFMGSQIDSDRQIYLY